MAAVLPNFRPTFEAIRRGRILMQVSAGFCSRKDMSLEKDALPLAVPQASSKTSPPVPEGGSLPTPPAKEPKRQTFRAVSTSERAAIPPGCPLVVAVASVPFARGGEGCAVPAAASSSPSRPGVSAAATERRTLTHILPFRQNNGSR